MVLDGMIALMKNVPGFTVVGTSTKPSNALAEIRNLNPDILITDLEMPEMDGIELTRQIRSTHPHMKVLALSMHHDYAKISKMVDAGVQGYILKSTGKEELGKALSFIMDGKTFFSDGAVESFLKGKPENETRPDKERIILTPREMEIVNCIAQEKSNEQIAETLFISPQTVETHRKNIMRKTEAKSAVGLVKMAIEKGWIS